MSIQDVLKKHQINANLNCECGYDYDQHNPNRDTFESIYTKHQAEMLEVYVKEREATLLEREADKISLRLFISNESDASIVAQRLLTQAAEIRSSLLVVESD